VHFLRHDLVVHVVVGLDILLEFVRSVGSHVHQLFCPSERSVSELCLFGRVVALSELVAAGSARAHADEECRAHHCYGPWLHVDQLEDVQTPLCLYLVPCDDVSAAAMREGMVMIMLFSSSFIQEARLLCGCCKKTNWPVSIFGSPMGATACT
jgi:hypothetical protein